MAQLVQDSREWGVWYDNGTKLFTTRRCADELGYTTRSATATVDKHLRRKKLRPYTRLPGRTGENVWVADEVLALIGE